MEEQCRSKPPPPPPPGGLATGQDQRGAALLDSPLLCASGTLTLTGLLDEGDHSKIGQVSSGVEFDVNVLRKSLPRLQIPDFGKTLHYTHVAQTAATVFAAQYLRLGMIQRPTR